MCHYESENVVLISARKCNKSVLRPGSAWTNWGAYSTVRGVVKGVDIGIYTPKISPSKLFMG